jgi:chromosome segregation ATPase
LDSIEDAKSLKKKIVESEEENAKLKETMARQDKELLLFGRLMSEVQCEASEASMARVRAESKLAKLTDELNNLKAEHAQFQEDHSIIKKDLGHLEEKHFEVLKQLKTS